MCKKIGFLVLVVGAFAALLQTTRISSYTSTAYSKVSNNLKGAVPLEFDIERVRNEVAQLVPDMKKNFSIIAEEMVAVENLRKEIVVARANLTQQKDNILTMTKDVESGAKFISYDGKQYNANRVREKLTRDFASFRSCELELRSKEQLLDAKERSLDAAREQLATLKSQKQELEVQVAQLEAELKTVRLAQSRNNVHVDDSQLARCKATLNEVRTRLDVEKKTSELEANFANDAIPVEKKTKSTGDLIQEIRTHLDDSSKSDVKVAEKE